jgi:hypothetical protein
MTKVVYNACYGGFGLSAEASKRYAELKGTTLTDEESLRLSVGRDINRADPLLVQVVEELGDAAGNRFASLKIAEVAPGTKYRIDEYDGNESIMTIDDYQWETA